MLSLALVLRAMAVMLMFRGAPRMWFYNQASELNCLAQSILSGQGLSSPFGGSTGPSAFLAPGYPLLVALVYRVSGTESLRSAAMLAALNVVFGVLTVLALMIVAKRLFGNRTAYIAGTLCAMSPAMVFLPALFWETSMSMLFLTAMLAVAMGCVDRPSPFNWIAFGAYSALAMFFNPALLVTFAGAAGWAAYKTRRVSPRAPWLAAVSCLVLFAAWPIRNAVVLHTFIPLRSNLGYELWQGNRLGSEGFFTPDLYLNRNREEYGRYAALGEVPYMREKSAIAVAAIRHDPIRFARLTLKRTGAFWTALGGHGISFVVIGEVTIVSLLGIGGLIAMLAQRREGGGLLTICFLFFPLPYYITHPDFRFRLLLEPAALLLSSWALQGCLGRLRLREKISGEVVTR